jgi:hypothetical protein
LVVEAGSNGSFLGRLELTLKPGGGISEQAFELVPILAATYSENAASQLSSATCSSLIASGCSSDSAK